MLLKHNIDTDMKVYTSGMTALDIARNEEGFEDIAQLIESYLVTE